MSKINAGVIINQRFLQANNPDSFGGYVDYINREEAVKKYGAYQEYMGDSEKTSSIFSMSKNSLNKDERKRISDIFDQSQGLGGVMWQPVISFDNKWLEKYGLYDSELQILNEQKVMEVVRESVLELLKQNGKDMNVIWTGAIHHNTDNIHVHLAMCEPIPNKNWFNKKTGKMEQRGKFKPKSLEAQKSKVVNLIIDRSKENQKINDIIRKHILEKMKSKTICYSSKAYELFENILKDLPKDKRMWNYKAVSEKFALSPVHKKIDQLTSLYIEKHHKKDWDDLNKLLEEETRVMKESYGSGEQHRYKDLQKNKLKDLYARMGNSILKELKEADQARRSSKLARKHLLYERGHLQRLHEKEMIDQKFERQRIATEERYYRRKALQMIERALQNDFSKWKNQRAFEELQQAITNEQYK